MKSFLNTWLPLMGKARAARMGSAPMEAKAGSHAQACNEANHPVHLVLVAGAAFALYWTSSFILEHRGATTHFGADSWHYTELAKGNVFERMSSNHYLDRIARFHPVTVFMAAAWMQLTAPLAGWLAPALLLKGMFAAAGAVGVWAAMSAFAALVPRRYVVLFGMIYAVTFGVWYFASIEESKIITATLSALYIAVYLRLRELWTSRRAVILTAILLLACLNEVVSGFLIIIPIIDMLARRGWDWRAGRWIAAHGLAGPLALVLVEGVMYGRLVGASNPEGASHFGLFWSYVTNNQYSWDRLYEHAINWLFFNIAAPTPHASIGVPPGATYKGYFQPALANYIGSPATVALAGLLVVMVAAIAISRHRPRAINHAHPMLLALAGFTLLRGTFFFIFNPYEPLLFSSTATLAHLLIIGVPLAISTFPAKRVLLGFVAVLLFVNNGAFIIGP